MSRRPPRILLGVSGGIAAYKAAELVRALVREEAEVKVVLTARGAEFVTPLTLATLSGHPVATSEFHDPPSPAIDHIDLARWADVLLVAPATANVLARFARGLADDLLSTVHLAFRGPVVLAPAMNPGMWEREQTRANVADLEARGVVIVPPEEGFVACGDEGAGRLADLQRIAAEALIAARRSRSMEGRKIVVSAGPTREAIDPVRYLSNRSSGKMGYAIAAALEARGAEVVLVSGPVRLSPPWGVERVMVESALEMREAVLEAAGEAAAVVMAAAVADHRPSAAPEKKISLPKDRGYALQLEPNPDILAELVQARAAGRLPAKLLLVGFAAETGQATAKGVAKRRRKGCDLLLANDVARAGSGFDVETNEVTLIGPDGQPEPWPQMSKRQVAERLADTMEKWWRR